MSTVITPGKVPVFLADCAVCGCMFSFTQSETYPSMASLLVRDHSLGDPPISRRYAYCPTPRCSGGAKSADWVEVGE